MGRIFEVRKSSMFARYDRMAKQFSRIGKEIAIAVKKGGSDPDTNPMLRRIVRNAKSINMPKDRIENAHATGFGYLHPSWAFTKSFYLRSGGYNRDDIRAFDTNFSTKTLRKFNWKKTVGEPNFGYCWFSSEYINSSPFEDCPMEIADREEKTSDIITEITPMMNERIKLLWKHFGW